MEDHRTYPPLYETIRLPEAHVNCSMVMVDIVGSTAAKQRDMEPAWIHSTVVVYDAIMDAVGTAGRGEVVKFMGDGALLAFNADDAAEAINVTIRIQEMLTESIEKRQAGLQVAIGIATGEVIVFNTPSGQKDYLGTTVDLCARLSGTLSAGGIGADAQTIASAPMHRIRSEVGEALRRTASEYQGKVQLADSLKGFSRPIEWHEIFWGRQLFGVRSDSLTAVVDNSQRPAAVPQRNGGTVARFPARKAQRGVVLSVMPEKQHVFVRGDAGESYFADSRFIVGNLEVAEEEVAFFSAVPGREGAKCDIAAALIVVGSRLTGKVVRVVEKGYAFVQVADVRGNTLDIFVPPNECLAGTRTGDEVSFRVADDPRGPQARDISVVRHEAA
jgi:class 3 adenylate cyclase/cold shock CspA family protein